VRSAGAGAVVPRGEPEGRPGGAGTSGGRG
jgi:hypothetical protein